MTAQYYVGMYPGERFNSITHLVGLVLALVGLGALLAVAAPHGALRVVIVGIYGAMLVILYVSSTLYHSLRGDAKKVFHIFDHCSIYLLIAGTYTPLTLITIRGAWGWSLFAVVWGLAIAGLVKDSLFRGRYRVISVVLYVVMGWSVVAAFGPLTRVMPSTGIAWLIAGGIFYTVGIVFYGLSKGVPYAHGIWHLFVIAGSVCQYVTVLLYVAPATYGV
ncbi:MAG TPA: hemolysin III family protein [Thermoanaerobaculia bacterium]|jgi:hemolysin III|nr:hemolysin III family protein [Thermoanaerobaculia bacterium]